MVPAYVRIVNAGYPDGLRINWRGRTHVFQSFEFLTWLELIFHVHHRLGMARLRVLAIATKIPASHQGRGGERELICLVQRLQK